MKAWAFRSRQGTRSAEFGITMPGQLICLAWLQAAMLLQQEVVETPYPGEADPAWSWAAAGELEAPMSTWD